MTAYPNNRRPSQETPVKYITLTDGTLIRNPPVCEKLKKKIKLKMKSIKGNEFKQGFQQGTYQQSIKSLAKGFLLGFLLCLVWVLVFFLASNTVRKHNDCSQNIPGDNNSKCQKRIVGYYNGQRNITEEQIEKLTHIIFNGIEMKEDGKIDFRSEEQNLMFNNMKKKARNMKSDVQLLFAIDAYRVNNKLVTPVMAESKMRKNWINSIASFLIVHQLDGVEIVYRWPIKPEEKENFAFFVRELRYKLEKVEKVAKRKIPFITCIHSPPEFWTSDNDPLLDDILNYVDFLNVETNNFYAPWHKGNVMTGPISPLYSLGNDNKSIDWTMRAYTCKTMKPSKLNVILPVIGAQWKNVSKDVTQADDLHFSVSGTNYSGLGFGWRGLISFGWNLTEASWHNVAKHRTFGIRIIKAEVIPVFNFK